MSPLFVFNTTSNPSVSSSFIHTVSSSSATTVFQPTLACHCNRFLIVIFQLLPLQKLQTHCPFLCWDLALFSFKAFPHQLYSFLFVWLVCWFIAYFPPYACKQQEIISFVVFNAPSPVPRTLPGNRCSLIIF